MGHGAFYLKQSYEVENINWTTHESHNTKLFLLETNSFHVDRATSLHMLVLLLHKGLDIWYIWNYALLNHKKSKIMTTIIKVIVEYNMIKFGTFIFVSYSFLIVVSSSGEGLVPSVNICKTCTPKQK